MDSSGLHAPSHIQEKGYKAAMWGGFAFGILGAIMAAVFMRGVGIVGHRPEDFETEGDIKGKTEGRTSDMEEDCEGHVTAG